MDSYYSDYSGSSKITEYLLSSKPVVINNQGALNSDIKPFLNIVENTNTEYLVKYIIEFSKILNTKEIKDKCKKRSKICD